MIHPTRFADAAGFGLRAFPCKPGGKEPIGPWKKFQDTTPTAEKLAVWDASNYNLGIVCGRASDVVVLDVDSTEAQKFVDSLNLPPTPTVRTARGVHLYFRCPNLEIRNTVNVEGVKLDVRGEGGYVIGAGSVHPSGAVYEWIQSPAEVPFAEVPAEVLAFIKPVAKKAVQPAPSADNGTPGPGGIDRFLRSELASAQTAIRTAEEGERNNTLFAMAVRIARHVAGAQADWQPFADALKSSALEAGLADREIGATVESGWRAGLEQPTAWICTAGEHVYLAAQERFYHLRSGKDLKLAGFDGQFGRLYSDRGSFARHLLKNGMMESVYDLTYEPLDPSGIVERDGYRWLNNYKPSGILAVSGDPAPFVDFMEGLVPEREERDHLLKMMAFTVRHPGRKLRHALLLRTGMQGVGKSMMIEIWGHLLGLHNVRKTTSKELASDFQSYLAGTLLVVCEELNLGMGARAYNDLKDMITSETVPVNEKFLKPRIWPFYGMFVFLTNLSVPMMIERSDRRIFFIDSPAEPRSPVYYQEFVNWWRENLGVIRNFLDAVDLSSFNPHAAPPMTQAKTTLIEASRSELAKELVSYIEERQGVFDRDIVTIAEILWSLDFGVRPRSRQQLIRALKEIGAVSLGQQRIPCKPRQSVWVIRNATYWTQVEPSVRAEEMMRDEGAFARINELGMEVGHLSQLPADWAEIMRQQQG